MNGQTWLSIVDYSTKHKISVSTLRRKIKKNDIEFRLQGGKYYIADSNIEGSSTAMSGFKLSDMDFVEESKKPNLEETSQQQAPNNLNTMQSAAEDAFSTAKELLEELKKSYAFILQEKEEQILYLKNEISDLKTLVKVLEDDNQKLRKYIDHLHEIRE
ncbi:MAG: hypothetical protein AB8E15_03600 [Bdellovibrionales bacterium]